MRKLILIHIAAFLLANWTTGYGQNKEFKNAIHAKINILDYGMLFNSNARVSQGFEVGYFRNVAPFLNVGVPFKLGIAKLPLKTDNTVTGSLDLVFHLENIRDAAKFSPYLFAGGGLFKETSVSPSLQFPFGAGLNFRISKYAFINLQGEFRKAMADNRDNVQVGAGFVYLLHKIELPPPPPPDTDGDSIPDLADQCPTMPGPASALGCPDKDGDGLGDQEDQCPDQKGPLETNGCPDQDNDGVADKDDKCPQIGGPVNGCPDRDGDGFADKEDKCPDVAGSMNGCPDKDGDGFVDTEDECPDQAGRWYGCPDTDFDGVADKDDKCPNDPGPAAQRGCPEPKDADKDGVNDFDDPCPEVAGTLKGCPDTDGDGVADKDDPCPKVAGTIKGCPDTDGDGVADNDDPCPNAAGKIKGCPDTDGDGVADNDDPCPNQPGKIKGCPDTDEDGVADKDDPCPSTAGKIGGCPDTDGDGVADKDDPCPSTAGKIKGCPDTDGDGVADKDDPCPNAAGKTGGCPDTDGDGIADNLDKCPNTPGVAGSQGCPEIKQETKERLAFATKNVQFETGKATLKTESYAILDEVYGILKQYPDYKLAIGGHTDDVGPDAANLSLSTERAKSCYDYLLFRGVPTNRLRYAGFGETRPVASNNSEAGRNANRRVEFDLVID